MPIDDHLLRDENILASARADEGGDLFATNKRVIWYKKSISRENVESLYAHIVSASYESKFHIGSVIMGILLLVGGLFVAPRFMYYIDFGMFSTFFITLGIILILIGILLRPKKYRINAPGLPKNHPFKTRDTREDAKTFARFIQDQIARREEPVEPSIHVSPILQMPPPPPYTPPTTEKIVYKEIVKIKCPYCKNLNPDNANHCTECGALLK